jgi:hypothetical protein
MTMRIGIIALSALALLAALLFSVPSFAQSTATGVQPIPPQGKLVQPLPTQKPLGTLDWPEAHKEANAWRHRGYWGVPMPPVVVEGPADVVIYRPLQRDFSKPYRSPSVHPGLRVLVDKQTMEHGYVGYNPGCPCNNCVRLRAAVSYFYRPRTKR